MHAYKNLELACEMMTQAQYWGWRLSLRILSDSRVVGENILTGNYGVENT
jgi:hypothetical protein